MVMWQVTHCMSNLTFTHNRSANRSFCFSPSKAPSVFHLHPALYGWTEILCPCRSKPPCILVTVPPTDEPNLWKADAILLLLKYCWVILLYQSQNLQNLDFISPLMSLTILSLMSLSMKVRSSRVFCSEHWSFGKVDIIIWLSLSHTPLWHL